MDASLIFLNGTWKQSEVRLSGRSLRIGRDEGMDLVIPGGDARYVSRHHVTLSASGGDWLLQDEGSTNGTFVNGRRVQRHVLGDGDVVRLGRELELRFAADADLTQLAPDGHLTALAGSMASVRDAGGVPPRESSRPERGGSGLTAGSPEGGGGASPHRTASTAVLAGVAIAVMVVGGAAFAFRSEIGPADPHERFPRLAEEFRGSVFLVETGLQYGDEYVMLGQGTAFAAAPGGYLITNKHVIQPHLYELAPACLAHLLEEEGGSFEDLLVVTVWQGGTPFRQPGQFSGDRGLGYNSRSGTLQVAATGSDNLAPERGARCPASLMASAFGLRLPDFTIPWRRHLQDNADLAVLRIDDDPEPFPLAEAPPERDTPVMAFGFPRGQGVIETDEADPVWRDGRVIRVQETIQTDAVIQGGNSGGPLIDERGEVVGITTRGTQDSLYNMAIQIFFARILLRQAR
jgi:S1-C subfamily serine protease